MGGYKPSEKNRSLLRRYKRGESIGFTARSSLRAKGLLPRVSKDYAGMYVLGPKYSPTGQDYVLGSKPSAKTRSRRHHRPSHKTRSRHQRSQATVSSRGS
jgi:hypothetical protein